MRAVGPRFAAAAAERARQVNDIYSTINANHSALLREVDELFSELSRVRMTIDTHRHLVPVKRGKKKTR